MKRFFLLFIIIVGFVACRDSKVNQQTAGSKSRLIEVFRASSSDYPNISVHRGGKGLKYYPENCLETIRYINDSITAIFEIDVAQTKDGQLVLMHDNSIDRTTTGSGLLKSHTYKSLNQYVLVDDYGNKTKYKIPLFIDVLNWCKAHNVILTVDIKRSVSQKKVIDAIKEAKAENICVIITYDLEQAKSAYALAPELLLSVSARNDQELKRLLASEIPTRNMLAFTGTRLSDTSLYQRLQNENIVCMLGTLGNLDRQAEARGDYLYAQWLAMGVNIIATDRPFEVYSAIKK
ncbi:glycerophosphodiester phosphodiesterase family protein [Winogradskyella aquimaris]|uniref:Glycerophosphodiester phosphodiesterase family protein n=1 Tax=Winogradskyella aquimaris TaxID=864074 RepID=A0ABU5EP19_9FLAO|nr:glycerophosphodiester phosphodiesterase family protein [Winogradskyella aquimaris]MDY2587801.1 glycerophosphodiester phosphodiesterase family protein [Winogradskyella aquimaris]